MKITIHKNEYSIADQRLSTFVSGYFLLQSLNLFVRLHFGPLMWWMAFSRGTMAILLLFALSSLTGKKMTILFFSEVLFLVMFLLTYLNGTYTDSFGSIVFESLCVYIPMAVSMAAVDSVEALLSKFYRCAWMSLFVLLYTVLVMRNTDYIYLMSLGYAFLWDVLIIIDNYINKKNWCDLVAIFLGIFSIIVIGSRGPLLCILIFFILILLCSNHIAITKKLIILFILAVLTITIVFWGMAITSYFYQLLRSLGFESRTLRTILTNSVVYSSGRESLYSIYRKEILARPFLGYGLAGGWIEDGLYPHNIFLELLLAFGIPFGVLILIVLCFIQYKGLRAEEDSVHRLSIVLISFCSSLLISGSFVTTPEFYICLAICSRAKLRIRIDY